MKPGRPLACGLWQNTPSSACRGNPSRGPGLRASSRPPGPCHLSRGAHSVPNRRKRLSPLPAAFSKSKKAGRREYLRARNHRPRQRFSPPKGSGRVSGLSWATWALVVLPNAAAATSTPGGQVTYIPFWQARSVIIAPGIPAGQPNRGRRTYWDGLRPQLRPVLGPEPAPCTLWGVIDPRPRQSRHE